MRQQSAKTYLTLKTALEAAECCDVNFDKKYGASGKSRRRIRGLRFTKAVTARTTGTLIISGTISRRPLRLENYLILTNKISIKVLRETRRDTT